MNLYELIFILKEDKEEIVNKIKTSIEEIAGIVKTAEKWGKKDFSYPMKKLSSGYYFIWQINLPQEKVNDLKKKMDFDENIVRHLLIKLKVKNEKLKI